MKKVILVCAILILMILSIDMITTVIAVNLGAIEQNWIAERIFELGSIGYIIALFSIAFIVLSVLIIADKLSSAVYKNLFNEEFDIDKRRYFILMFSFIYVLLDIGVIIHNILVILELILG